MMNDLMEKMKGDTKKWCSILLAVIAILCLFAGWIGVSPMVKDMGGWDSQIGDFTDSFGGDSYSSGGLSSFFDYSGISSDSELGSILKDGKISAKEGESLAAYAIVLGKSVNLSFGVSDSGGFTGMIWGCRLYRLAFWCLLIALIATIVLRVINHSLESVASQVGVALYVLLAAAGIILCIWLNNKAGIDVIGVKIWPFVGAVLSVFSMIFWNRYQLDIESGKARGDVSSVDSLRQALGQTVETAKKVGNKGMSALRSPWKCPNCGNQCSGSADFCPGCGAARPEERKCPHCGTILGDGAMFCAKCGTKYEKISFCPNCGKNW